MTYCEAVDVLAYAAYSHANLSETKRFPTKLGEALNVLRYHAPFARALADNDGFCEFPVVSPV